MNISPAKENMLKRIRKALSHSTPIPFPQSEGTHSVFQSPQQEPAIEFAERFTALQGKFIYCSNHAEMTDRLNDLVKHYDWKELYCREEKLKSALQQNGFSQFSATGLGQCDAGITSCEVLIARTGSIVMSTAQESGRTVSVYAPIHICIAYTSQLVYDIKEGLQLLKEKYQNNLPSLITFATGPSRTADIEKTLVVGVHGPKEVYLLLIEKPEGTMI